MYLLLSFSIAIHAAYIGSRIAISLYALQLGASQFTIGMLAAMSAIAPLALGVYSGRIADTHGTRWPLLGGAILLLVGMLTSVFSGSIPGLMVNAALGGAGFMFFNVSIQTLTGSLGGSKARAHNFAVLSVGYSVSTFIGPMSVGLAIDHLGYRAAFVMLGLFTLLPIVGLQLTRRYDYIDNQKPAQDAAQRSMLDLLRLPKVRSIIIVSGLVSAAWDLFSFYLPVYAHALGFSATLIGTILGVCALAAFITRFAMSSLLRRWRAERVMGACVVFAAGAFALFPLSPNLYYMLVMSFCLGLGLGCGQPLSMTLAYNRAPEGRAGEVTGLRLSANNAMRVVVPVVCGALGSTFGATPVFLLTAMNLGAISYLLSRE